MNPITDRITSSGTVLPAILTWVTAWGVDQGEQLLVAVFETEHDAQALHPAAGGTGAGAHEHAKQKDELAHAGPLLVVAAVA